MIFKPLTLEKKEKLVAAAEPAVMQRLHDGLLVLSAVWRIDKRTKRPVMRWEYGQAAAHRL